MASKSTDDAFESIKAPQFYDNLAAMDSQMDDGADEFFDTMTTPQRAPREEFFTPAALPDLVPRAESSRSSVTPMNVTPPAPPAPAKTTLSPVAEEPEPVDTDWTEGREHKSLSNMPQERVKLKARRRSLQAQRPTTATQVNKRERQAVESLSKRVFDGIKLDEPLPDKSHPMTTRQDVQNKTPKLSLRSRSVLRMQLKRKTSVMSPARESMKPAPKYLAMAEQVEHFFKDTPERYHTVPASEPPKFPEKNHLKLTVPESPLLLTKHRARSPSPPPVEEQVQIKALPLNPKVFAPPDRSSRPAPRPSTIPEPFNLTEVPKKEPKVELPGLVQFKARPVPRSCRSSLSSVASVESAVSLKRVPVYKGSEVYEERDGVISKKRETTHIGVPQSHLSGARRLEVKPFSFDMRDRMARQKKEAKIRKAIEESTKVPKFTARPLPSYLNATSDSMSDVSSVTSISTRKSIYHHHIDETPTTTTFKAKPPTVLFKEPFKPKKESKPLTDVTEFQLNTERRARERAEHEKLMQLKAKEEAEALNKRMEEDEKKEKAEIRELRKSLVHKARPVPKFNAGPTIQEEP